MRPRLDDPDWLDRQYDNRARVPEHGRHFANWAEASALARERTPAAQFDLRYGEGLNETLDLFPPSGPVPAGGAPVLIFIHGGYWRSLDKRDFGFVAPAFNAAGALVLVPNHALCPAVSIEHIVLQMALVVAWAHDHAAEHGGDPARIVLVGHSAGAHLAAMLLACRWKELDPTLPARPVQGALAISGLYDLEPLRHAPVVKDDLRLTPASVARLSPAFFPRPSGGAAAPKLFAVVGLDESEEFLRHTTLIRDAWGPTAVPVCETLPGCDHFSVLTPLADPASRLHRLALRLLGLA